MHFVFMIIHRNLNQVANRRIQISNGIIVSQPSKSIWWHLPSDIRACSKHAIARSLATDGAADHGSYILPYWWRTVVPSSRVHRVYLSVVHIFLPLSDQITVQHLFSTVACTRCATSLTWYFYMYFIDNSGRYVGEATGGVARQRILVKSFSRSS